MKQLFALVKSEPVAAQAVVQTGLAMLMAFGLGMTAEQMAAVLAFTGTILAFITRANVTANHVVAQKVESALMTPVPAKEKQ